MEFIQGVSLPRSGHNLLVRHLQSYFRSQNVCSGTRNSLMPFLKKRTAAQSRNTKSDRNSFHYCEYYYSCRCRPCRHLDNKFQKSHDFDLDLPVERGKKYIVQTRNTAGMMISWFELRLTKNREVDTPDGFRQFMRRNRSYIDGFQRKWIDSSIHGRLMLDYDDYLARPIDLLSEAIAFFAPNQLVNREFVAEIVRDVRPAKDNRKFRFFDAVMDYVAV